MLNGMKAQPLLWAGMLSTTLAAFGWMCMPLPRPMYDAETWLFWAGLIIQFPALILLTIFTAPFPGGVHGYENIYKAAPFFTWIFYWSLFYWLLSRKRAKP